jgi:transketolase
MPLDANELKRLKDRAKKIREDIVIVTEKCGGSHVGGSMSQTDILVALYHKFMTFDPKKPDDPNRDRFILSKGHGGVGHAVVLGDLGCFPKESLYDFNKTGSPFGMHLDANKVIGVDASTGSLGHGLGIGLGMAMGARLKGETWHTYVVLGDGECNEGSIWEAAMSASHYKVTNLTCFVDRNMLMIDGRTEEVMGIEPFRQKWEAFGWRVLEADGHDFNSLSDAIETSLAETEKPVVIIANTVKGKGVDFMENDVKWHYAGLDSEMAKKALESIRRG